jgi:hypothetical protein
MRVMTDLFRIMRFRRRPDVGSVSSLPCHICGVPASGWEYSSRMKGNQQVIEGSPVCDAHSQSRVHSAAG